MGWPRLDLASPLRSVSGMTIPYVSAKRDVLGGEPCFEGTTVPVDVLFVNLAAGERLDVIIDCYPAISREAALGLLREACEMIRRKAVEQSALSSEESARIGPLMHEHDWAGLETTDSAAHYRGR